jgi:DNA-binding PadR family transcriptional regulator
MKASQPISLLGYALLGLIHQKPVSGYDLRRTFSTTPMGSFSDSPGAIYPALRRLEAAAFIRGRIEKSAGLRQRQIFHITASGLVALKEWLATPITRPEIVRHLDAIMLRFAFMDGVAGPAHSHDFLCRFAEGLNTYVQELHAYFDPHHSGMPLSARLALESGIRSYEAQWAWARSAVDAYARMLKGKRSAPQSKTRQRKKGDLS